MFERQGAKPVVCDVCGYETTNVSEVQSWWMSSFWICRNVRECNQRRPPLGPTP